MKIKYLKNEHRTQEQIRDHYEIEKELANRLRYSLKHERRYLYSSLYNELFRRVPLHPQLTRKISSTKNNVELQMKFLKPYLSQYSTYMEVGPGDCALAIEMTRFVKRVYAIDVSEEITKIAATPNNFQLILSDGNSIPIPGNTVNIAYSNQLMEHLHPDDAFEQLQNIYDTLAPHGIYICITPNKLTGPHDISKYFDVVATGFHLREYTVSELVTLFKNVGFSEVRNYIGAKGYYIHFPTILLTLFEYLLCLLPFMLRNSIAHSWPVRALLNIRLVAKK